MWKYLIKRLLIAVPTLLGITILTFCIIRLAPGDPTRLSFETEGPFENLLSREHVEQTRRLFGLDKPIVINLDVMDARRTVLSAWERVLEYEEAIRRLGEGEQEPEGLEGLREAHGALKALGKRMIPHLVPLALERDPGAHEYPVLAGALMKGAGVEAASSPEKLAEWWEANAESFTPAEIDAALIDLAACPESELAERTKRIREHLGDLALPRIAVLVHEIEDESARNRLIALAAPRVGYRGALKPDSPLVRYENALRSIDQWQERVGLSYREIGPSERFLRTFTETQYALWLWRICRLDFGESFIDFQPVTRKVWDGFKVTLSFQIIVILLIYLIAVPLGVYSAVKQGTIGDRLTTLFLFMLYSLPNFWVAYLLIFLLGEGDFARIFPIQGLNSEGAETWAFFPWLLDRLWHMCLPLACMTYGGLAVLSRYTRSGMLEVIRQDYVRTARAKGLSERVVVLKHALRNGVIPIVTLLGGLLPTLISGSIIIEYIFGIHGMGWLGYTAVLQRDYPVVMAIAFFSALLVLIGTLLSDVLYAAVDPRIRFEGGPRDG